MKDLDGKATTALAFEIVPEIVPEMVPLSIFQRLAGEDRTAIKDCIDTYGNFIWALARKFTESPKEAETVTERIFTDIWQYAQQAAESPVTEKVLIALIVRRRLIKCRAPAETKSMITIDTKSEQELGVWTGF